MRAEITGKLRHQLVRTIIWRTMGQAPRDGRLIEVAWLEGDQKGFGPKRTRWINGQWEGGYKPTHWRTIERTGTQYRGFHI